MQWPTHILAGMILRRTFAWRYYRGLGIFLTAVTALLAHGILDKIGVSAYDPPHVDFTDPFWLVFHISVWLLSLVMLYMFWGEYRIGIFFALLPDLDWAVLHTADAFGKEVIFYKTPLIHNAINLFIDNVIPFSYLNLLPDHRLAPWACIWEILTFGMLLLIFRAQLSRRRNIHF